MVNKVEIDKGVGGEATCGMVAMLWIKSVVCVLLSLELSSLSLEGEVVGAGGAALNLSVPL
jgi:hypothetical protein